MKENLDSYLGAPFEEQMIARRRWSPEEWRGEILGKPQTAEFAQTVLWASYGEEPRPFRVGDDLGLITIDDVSFDPGQAPIGILHPAEIDEVSQRRWEELFSDYEIAQAFLQLGRAVHRGELDLERFANAEFPSRGLFELRDRGWRWRMQGATVWGLRRTFESCSSIFRMECVPGFTMGDDMERVQTIVAVERARRTPDVVAVSETMADFVFLTR